MGETAQCHSSADQANRLQLLQDGLYSPGCRVRIGVVLIAATTGHEQPIAARRQLVDGAVAVVAGEPFLDDAIRTLLAIELLNPLRLVLFLHAGLLHLRLLRQFLGRGLFGLLLLLCHDSILQGDTTRV